jgi:hypothetical protein
LVKKARRPKTKVSKKRSFTHYLIGGIVVGLVIVVTLYYSGIQTLPSSSTSSTNNLPPVKPRALIADSLALDYPDPQLIDNLTRALQESGYEVDLVTGSDVNMTLYSRLTDYDLIILRVHGGKAVYKTPDGTIHKINGLFTGVPWSDEYTYLKLNWIATRARPFNSNKTFLAVLPKFFDTRLKGRFRPGAVVIVASCYSLFTNDIANSLGRKGLTAFIGWEGPVSLDHMDKIVEALVNIKLKGNITWVQAVKSVNEKYGPDPTYNDYLKIVIYGH